MRRAVLRLERRVRDEGIVVVSLDHYRCALQRAVRIAIFPQRACRWLLREFLGALREALAALLRGLAFIPRHLQLLARRARLPPTVRNNRHTAKQTGQIVAAFHQLSATIATPQSKPVRSLPPSTTNACRTPGMALISSTFALTTRPANTGHFWNTAESMPGIVKSMPKIGLPVKIAALSTPGVDLPMIL